MGFADIFNQVLPGQNTDLKQLKLTNQHLVDLANQNNVIAPENFKRFDIKHGLRNNNGTGVLVGITGISDVHGYQLIDGEKSPDEGRLYYRGIDLYDIVSKNASSGTRLFEETIFLLLFGQLPNPQELEDFNNMIDAYRQLPQGFTENMILKIPSQDIMNKLQRSILVLYSHDEHPDELAVENLILQCIKLIARVPTIVSYGYQAKRHYFDRKSLFIHAPKEGVGTAENILHMIRSDNQYTETEASTLDLALVLHADHGGGNNSAFAVHVVSSSGTDTYSAISTAVGSLKGPKHGGANNRVRDMMLDLNQNVTDIGNADEIRAYLEKVINKEAYDGSGLIYGLGHAVYTKSDPRAVILKEKARQLATEKGKLKLFSLYENVELIGIELLRKKKGPGLTICANVDLYSGLVYQLLDIPEELYTPLFAVARMAGWCAHRIEQVMSDTKIIRPAYVCPHQRQKYTPLSDRK
ncbi:citrate/2-methylcitrate synthase [Fusibacter ferrireducens]|uniref:Citrate synthase n=1 Tax=Fusibacter ferrireducens TaxID=2785058 RepID=A0ABR9ZS75_9FIRM|nr:citrate/2-methylcitrate synthase [Fusibacter ferrireducens]MBF4693290.1 citrate/2-methylcitrate synthase [Fusibacter ferrireducens]